MRESGNSLQLIPIKLAEAELLGRRKTAAGVPTTTRHCPALRCDDGEKYPGGGADAAPPQR